jgi:hypothetical protein
LGVEIKYSELSGKQRFRLQPACLIAAGFLFLSAPVAQHAQTTVMSLPEAPSTLLFAADKGGEDAQTSKTETADTSQSTPHKRPTPSADQVASASLPPCPKRRQSQVAEASLRPPFCEPADQLQLIVDTGHVSPLTSTQKGVLAFRAATDPFNLLTIATFSAVSVAADSHSVYGPGFKGWGRLSGYSFAEDAQEDFTGIYLIPSLVHEDPRYHRMPGAPVRRRIEHALIHTFVSQHDDGALMPNYATIINYPLTAEISNLYVPGIATNGVSTAKRVLVGYATDPVGPLVAEFLPDFAKRVHIHIIFAQQILNHIALGSGAQSSSF